jgi:diguanylate cyclase (GGDEF)-like protein
VLGDIGFSVGGKELGEGKSLPNLDIFLPTSLWRRFADHFRRATGIRLTALDRAGSAACGEPGHSSELCEKGSGSPRCAAFYRKLAQQVLKGEDALLFRCPGDRLVFGVALPCSEEGEDETLVLAGAECADLGEEPALSPRRLVDCAQLAQLSLRSAAHGQQRGEASSRRRAQVITLFQVAADLAQTDSTYDFQALALNALGVVFDVSSAALLMAEPEGQEGQEGQEGSGTAFRVLTAMGALEAELRSWTIPAGSSALQEVLPAGCGLARVEDSVELRRLALPEAAERLLLLPLAGPEGVIGLLALVNSALSAEDEQLVRAFALQLARATENQRLDAELRQKRAELEFLHRLSREFLTCLEPDALFRSILQEACKLTAARKGSVMLRAPGGEELFVQAVRGVHEKLIQKLRLRIGEGVAGRVFATGEPVLVRNLELDPRFRRKNRPHYATKSFLSLPITGEGGVAGVLNLSDKESGGAFLEEDLRQLRGLLDQAALAVERSSYYLQSRELRKISITDPLTGLLNRRYFQERLAEEVDRSSRHGHPLSLIMVDIDQFKAYNDANGHPAGDKALVLAGRALRSSIRAIDVVSRFGGEEFAVILPETRSEEACEIAERIRKEVETLYFPGEESIPGGKLTISLGVAGFPEDAKELKALIHRADRALYAAKEQGRNRVAAAASLRTPPEETWTKVF